jgi:hypothetical protein
MRINEIASAEDQMALWRLVSDSVWQAIETQRQQQAQEQKAKAAKAKLKPRKSRKGAKIKNSIPIPLNPKAPPAKKIQGSADTEQTKSQNGQSSIQGHQFIQRQQTAQSVMPPVPTTPINAPILPTDRNSSIKALQNNPKLQGDDSQSKYDGPVTPIQKFSPSGFKPKVG